MKSKKCNYKVCTNPVWSGGLCKNHTPKKSLKKQRRAVFHTDKEGRKKMDKVFQMHTFFMTIWAKKPHKSEVSGTYLGGEALSIYFHHILPKNKYPKASLDEDNIILLTFDEHQDVESDIYKFEEVNKRRELLKIKYDL